MEDTTMVGKKQTNKQTTTHKKGQIQVMFIMTILVRMYTENNLSL